MPKTWHISQIKLQPSYDTKELYKKLEMLAHLTAGQLDGRRQADDDFGGRVKMTLLFLAVSGPKFTEFWDNVGDPL